MRFFLLICAVTVLFVQSALGQSAEGGSVEAGSVEAGSVEAGSVEAGSTETVAGSTETVASGGSEESGETTGFLDNADYYGDSADTDSDTSDTTKAQVAQFTNVDADVGPDPCEGKQDIITLIEGECVNNKQRCSNCTDESYGWMVKHCKLTCCRVEYPEDSNCNSVKFNNKQLEVDKKNLEDKLALQIAEDKEKYDLLGKELSKAQSASGTAKASWRSNLDDSGNRIVKCKPTCIYLADTANCSTYNLDKCDVVGFEPFDIAVWNSFHKWKLSKKPKSCVTKCRKKYAKCETAADNDDDSDDISAAYAVCEDSLIGCLDKCIPVETNELCATWTKNGYCRNDKFNTLDECPKSCSDLSSQYDFCSSCSSPSGYLCQLAIDVKCKADPNLPMCKTERKLPSFWQAYGKEYQSQCEMDLCTMCQQHREEKPNEDSGKVLLDNCEIAKQVECKKDDPPSMCSDASSVWKEDKPFSEVPELDKRSKKNFNDYKELECENRKESSTAVIAYNFNYYLDFMTFVSKMDEQAHLDAAMPLSTKCARSCCEKLYSQSDLSVVQCCADGYKFCFGTETCVPTEEPCLVCPDKETYCQPLGLCLPESVSCVPKTLYDLVKPPQKALPNGTKLGKFGGALCNSGEVYCPSKTKVKGKCISELTEKCKAAIAPKGYTSIGIGFCYDKGGLLIANRVVKKIDDVAACADECDKPVANCDGFSFDSNNKENCRLYGQNLNIQILSTWKQEIEKGIAGKTIRFAKTSNDPKYKIASSSSLCFAKAAKSSSSEGSTEFEIRSSNHPAYCVALTKDGGKAVFETCVGGKSSQTFTFKDEKLKSLSGICLTKSGKGAIGCPDKVKITSVQAAAGKSNQIKVGSSRCLWGKSVSSPLKMAKCSSSKQPEQVFLISIISSTEF